MNFTVVAHNDRTRPENAAPLPRRRRQRGKCFSCGRVGTVKPITVDHEEALLCRSCRQEWGYR